MVEMRGGREGQVTYDQVAGDDLQNLCAQARVAGKDALQDVDEEVAHGGADEGAVDGHLGHAAGQVAAVLADVAGNVRGEHLLRRRQSARGDHLGAQRVRLQGTKVGLRGACQLGFVLRGGLRRIRVMASEGDVQRDSRWRRPWQRRCCRHWWPARRSGFGRLPRPTP